MPSRAWGKKAVPSEDHLRYSTAPWAAWQKRTASRVKAKASRKEPCQPAAHLSGSGWACERPCLTKQAAPGQAQLPGTSAHKIPAEEYTRAPPVNVSHGPVMLDAQDVR